MELVRKALNGVDPQAVQEIAEMLFGAGADEIIKMAMPAMPQLPKRDSDMPKATGAQKAALAGNSVAIAGGLHALSATKNEFKAKAAEKGVETKTPKAVVAVGSKINGALKPITTGIKSGVKAIPGVAKLGTAVAEHPKATLLASTGAAVGLHGVELHADFAGRRAMKQQYGLSKSVSEDIHPTQIKGKLVELGINTSFGAAKKVPSGSKKLRDAVTKSVDFDIPVEIVKSDDDKRLVFGWASIVKKDGKDVIDLQGDYMDIETVEKAAYNYVQKSRKGGYEHQRNGVDPRHVSDLVESIVITAEKKEALGLPDDAPEGWWTGFKVHDDESWADVKSGKVTEFSIHGSGVRKDM